MTSIILHPPWHAACIQEVDGKAMIMLWQGTELEYSHRHHSHLAGISPFDIFDIENENETVTEVVMNSINHWISKGTGYWSGWCAPWAAMIMSRVNNGEAAQLFLESWQRVFTNEGHGTTHDAHAGGFTLLGMGRNPQVPSRTRDFKDESLREIMQMDGGMGADAVGCPHGPGFGPA